MKHVLALIMCLSAEHQHRASDRCAAATNKTECDV